jgi:hypothetical protein
MRGSTYQDFRHQRFKVLRLNATIAIKEEQGVVNHVTQYWKPSLSRYTLLMYWMSQSTAKLLRQGGLIFRGRETDNGSPKGEKSLYCTVG